MLTSYSSKFRPEHISGVTIHTRSLTRILVPILAIPLSLATLATPSQAAACAGPDGETKKINISSIVATRVGTNKASAYLAGPGTISGSFSGTATASASATFTATGEMGAIFTKVSLSAGVTVGGSYAWTDSWTYSKAVPRGRTARMRLFRESRRFTATKYNWRCSSAGNGWVQQYTTTINAPRRDQGAYDVWDLEYR